MLAGHCDRLFAMDMLPRLPSRRWSCSVAALGTASRRGALVLAALLAPVAPCRADTRPGLAHFQAGQFAEAFEDWRRAAGDGDARAALLVGVMYDTGQGVAQNYAEALSWYRRAAEAGSPSGMFNVGVMFDAGRGTARDPQEAARWYDRAAAAGFGRAEYNLGLMYQDGSGVRRDRAHAVRLFQAAARHGIAAARLHLAELGVASGGAVQDGGDPSMQDFRHAQSRLLLRGSAEMARAAELFRHAAEQGDALAQYDLGYCYENGLGTPVDPLQAFRWYRRSAAEAREAGLRALADASARVLAARLGPDAAGEAAPAGAGPLTDGSTPRAAPER